MGRHFNESARWAHRNPDKSAILGMVVAVVIMVFGGICWYSAGVWPIFAVGAAYFAYCLHCYRKAKKE